MSDEQLGLTLKDTEKHLFQLRLQSATDRLETPSEIRKARKEIARIRTVQRERELQRLQQDTPEALSRKIADLQEGANTPGKRRRTRTLKRLRQLLSQKTSSGQAPPGKTTPKR